jgi:hypothetical protein
MPGEQVCKAWLQEFNRLKNKVYVDFSVMIDAQTKFTEWSPSHYKQINIFDEMFGSEKRDMFDVDDLDLGAGAGASHATPSGKQSEFDRVQRERMPVNFMLHNRGPRHSQV